MENMEGMDGHYSTTQKRLLWRWKRASAECAREHKRVAHKTKLWHYSLMIPSIVIPLIMAPFDGIIDESSWLIYTNIAAFIVSGTTAALAAFFDFGAKRIAHNLACVGYKEIITQIDGELAKPASTRDSIELLIQSLQMKMQFLEQTSPNINTTPLISGVLAYDEQDALDSASSIDASREHIENVEHIVNGKKKQEPREEKQWYYVSSIISVIWTPPLRRFERLWRSRDDKHETRMDTTFHGTSEHVADNAGDEDDDVDMVSASDIEHH